MKKSMNALSLSFLLTGVAAASPMRMVCSSTGHDIEVCVEDPNVYRRVSLTTNGSKRFLPESADSGIYKDDEYTFDATSFDGTFVVDLDTGAVIRLQCQQATTGFCR